MLPNSEFWPKVGSYFVKSWNLAGTEAAQFINTGSVCWGPKTVSELTWTVTKYLRYLNHQNFRLQVCKSFSVGYRYAHPKAFTSSSPSEGEAPFLKHWFLSLGNTRSSEDKFRYIHNFNYSRYLAMDDSQIIHNSNTFPETICWTILTEWIWRGKKNLLAGKLKA